MLGILLLATGVFGQRGGGGMCEFFQPARIDRDVKWFNPTQTYSFEINGKTYMLSYDTSKEYLNFGKTGNEVEKRNVYLHRLDNDGWKIASTVVKTDYWCTDENRAYDMYYQNMADLSELIDGIGTPYVNRLENGIVKIRLLSFYSNERADQGFNYRWDEIVLIPQGDETYLAAKITQ